MIIITDELQTIIFKEEPQIHRDFLILSLFTSILQVSLLGYVKRKQIDFHSGT
jgi:hypothetical protein